ncbi:MAG: glycosyltransferase family 39 protein [Anaerolineae bacterium]
MVHNPPVQAVRSWSAKLAVPVAVFVINRGALFLLVYLSLIFLPMNPASAAPRTFPENLFLDGWVRWDSYWYGGITAGGYSAVAQDGVHRNVAFFPMYPLATRGVAAIIPNIFMSGLIVSNVAFLLALILLYRLVSARYNASVARRTIVLLSVFPFSFYFSAMYPEALFLLAFVAAFYFGEQRRWLLAGLCAAVASATREVGIAVVLGLAILYLEQVQFDWRRIRPNILWLLLGLAGLGGYFAYLGIQFGDPLLSMKSHFVPGWLEGVTPDMARETLVGFLTLPSGGLAAGRYSAILVMELLIFFGALLLSVLGWRRLPIPYAVMGTLVVLLSFSAWIVMGRLVAPIFPLFMALALILDEKPVYEAVVYASSILLALLAIMFSHAYWVA